MKNLHEISLKIILLSVEDVRKFETVPFRTKLSQKKVIKSFGNDQNFVRLIILLN